MQKLNHRQVETEIEETMEECYGRDVGDISAILNRGAAQRRLNDAIKPETD